jgi:hypothetical protein
MSGRIQIFILFDVNQRRKGVLLPIWHVWESPIFEEPFFWQVRRDNPSKEHVNGIHFYLPHMEYEESFGLLSRKMKKKLLLIFTF